MNATEKIMSNTIRRIITDEELGWPPVCWGPFYQPERPVRSKEARDVAQEQKSPAEE